MKERVGEVFSIAKDNQPILGCTISKEVHGGDNYFTYFSLAKNTDISAEIYPYHKFLVVNDGSMEIYGTDGFLKELKTGDSILTLIDTPTGMRTSAGAVYTEISIRRTDIMNLQKLLERVGHTILQGPEDPEVHAIINDSRKVEKGDLFFCIRGAVTDGHMYAQQVIEKGIAGYVSEKVYENIDADVPHLLT